TGAIKTRVIRKTAFRSCCSLERLAIASMRTIDFRTPSVRPAIGLGVNRFRIFFKRGLVDSFCKVLCRSTIVPRRCRDPFRLWLEQWLQIISRRSDFGKFHVGGECEIEAAVPQHRNRHIDLAVVKSLENGFQGK